MFLLAERMRNAGKYTIADVLSFRLNETPARAAAALGTFAVVTFYLIAQMVGAGVLIEKLVGIDFSIAVIITGVFMLCYVIFGGMVATTWVQIIKAVLLMAGIFVMSVFVLGQGRLQPDRAVQPRGREQGGRSRRSRSAPGTYLPKPLDTVSLGLALVLGTAGLPHILMRFFTVPNAKAARSSVVWAMFIIGFFYLLTTFIGFGARAFLGEGGVEARGHRRQPRGAEPGRVPRRRRGHVRRRPVPGGHRRASPSRRSSPWSPGLVLSARRRRSRTTSGPRSSARARTPSTRRCSSRGSRRSRSA